MLLTSCTGVPTSMTLNDLEPSKQTAGFSDNFAIFGYGAHLKSELRRNG